MQRNNRYFITVGLILGLILTHAIVIAQNRISSPYSRYGVGDLQSNTNARFMGMGGVSSSYSNPLSINYTNPASYVAFDSTSFVFEGGLFGQFSELKTSTLSQQGNYFSVAYLSMGFPILRGWRMSLGILPYSKVGYTIIDQQQETSIGNVDYLYEGDGGLSQFYWGNGVKINKSISLGCNLSYLFGDLDEIRSIKFPDSANLYNIRLTNSRFIGGLNYQLGLLFKKPMKENMTFSAGFTFSNASTLNANDYVFAERFVESSYGYEYVKDTLANHTTLKGKVYLPSSFAIGLAIEKNEKWLIGTDFQWQNWKNFKFFDKKDSLQNSMRVAIGAEYTPKADGRNYFQQIHYRAGFRYSQSYLELKKHHLNEWAISCGVGLPMRRSKSTVNIAIEYGQFGTTSDMLIQQRFTRFVVGLSIYERWFIRRKFL